MTNQEPKCPRCSASRSPDAAGGLCPVCVLSQALVAPEAAEPQPQAVDAAALEAAGLGAQQPIIAAERFGDYRLEGELGRGGMGIIYRARQLSLNRTVALKMILAGPLSSADFAKRLRVEAEAAAGLDHPNIVAIYEVGEHEGQPFFTMRWVEGTNLAQALKAGPFEPKRAASLMITVARAIQHAHERGVLHRDLKPSNILLDTQDQPHVTDFGLAKFVHADSTLTLSQATLGTPSYMAPEQASGGSKQVTTAADVYSLGAILYELLTGRPLFQADTPLQAIQQVVEREPERPSRINPCLDRDLETICLKCLQKEPKRRYASAGALADDLERWLASQPIQARPVGRVERGWLWCRRKPALAGLTGALAFTVIVGSALAGWRIAAARQQERQARQQERQARERERLETYASSIALANSYIKNGSIDRALNLLYNCPPEFRHWEWGHLLYLCHQDILSIPAHTNAPSITASVRYRVSLAFDSTGSKLVTHGSEGRVKVWNVADGRELFGIGDATNRVTSWAVHPRGMELAVGMTNGEIRIFDTANWQQRPVLETRLLRRPMDSSSQREGDSVRVGPQPQSPTEGVTSLAYDPSGRRLAAATSRGRVQAWDLQSRRELFTATDEPVSIERVWFTPDGRQVVTQRQFAVRRFEAETGDELFAFSLDPEKDWAVFADLTGQHLATIDLQNRVTLWANHRRTHELGFLRTTQSEHRRAFFSLDGQLVCTAGDQSTAQLYEVETGRKLFAIPARTHAVAFSPDGKRLVVTGAERVARLWDVAEQQVLLTLRGHLSMAQTAAFSPDGRFIAMAGLDGVVKIWSSSPGRERYRVGRWAWAGTYSPDGKRLSAGGWWEHLKIWDAESGRPEVELKSLCHSPFNAAFNPDGTRIVTVGTEKVARIWDATSGDLVRVLRGHTRSVMAVAWSRDGRWIATYDVGGVTRVWDATTGKERHTLPGNGGYAWGLSFDPAGRRLTTAGHLGPPQVWDVESGTLRLTLREGSAGSWAVRFSPNGRQVIAVGFDRRLRIWDARSGRLVHDWQSRTFGASQIGCSPDGRRAAVPVSDFSEFGFDSGMFEIWDLQHGRALLELANHTENPTTAEFSPNGRRLLTTAADFTARQEESFPWQEEDYDSFEGATLPERVRSYARKYWRERLAVEAKAALNPTPRSSRTDPDRALFQPRDPQAGPNLIDLSAHYTGVLDAVIFPTGSVDDHDDDLEALLTPTGLVTRSGVRFDVRGVVLLWRVEPCGAAWQGLWDRYPKRVTGITIGRHVQHLQVLHGVWSQTRIQDGKAIGSFVWHFADGSQRETEIVYGRDVRNWCQGGNSPDPQRDCERGQVVWDGDNPVAKAQGATRRLYLTPYDNPQPDLEVTSLDFVSKGTQAAPFLVAMTVEP